jgi:hypothetical protein
MHVCGGCECEDSGEGESCDAISFGISCVHQSTRGDVTSDVRELLGADDQNGFCSATLKECTRGVYGDSSRGTCSFDAECWWTVRKEATRECAEVSLFRCFASDHIADDDGYYDDDDDEDEEFDDYDDEEDYEDDEFDDDDYDDEEDYEDDEFDDDDDDDDDDYCWAR